MARFGEGEAALLDCATMLRDCADSKRVSRDVSEAQEALAAAEDADGSEGEAPSLDLLLLSHHYWPALPKEQPRLHPSLQATFDAAAHTYAVKRKPRHLKPVSSQGFVSLQVEVEGAGGEADLRDIVCSVPQASALLWAMDAMRDDEDSPAACSLTALAGSLAVSAQLTLQLVTFWVRLGVLRLQTMPGAGACVVMAALAAADAETAPRGAAEEGEPAGTGTEEGDDDDDESDTAGAARARSDDDENAAAAAEAAASASSSGDPPEAVATWTGFVTGMLTNLGALPLERIHNMLQMFAGMGAHPYEKSMGELRGFLATLEREGLLALQADQTYALTAS